MLINVKYFGSVAEKTETNQSSVECEEGTTLRELTNELISSHQLNDLEFKLALNQKIVSDDPMLSNEDELAFLPPFSGG